MRCTAVTIVLLLLASSAAAQPSQNIIIVTLDGLRWQEVFRGYDETFADKENGGVQNPKRLHEQFARPDTQQSRAALMPFLWNTLAPSGQLFGNHDDGSTARVTNPHHFSYPGYSELLCGFVEPRIDSNDPVPNPNVTVLEWLNRRPGFENRVAVFGAWTRFREILNVQRSRLHVVAGWDPIAPFNNIPLSPREETLNALLTTQTRMWPDEPPDAIVAQAALEHLRKHKPRVLYIGFGETDEWAHARRYDLYLESARRADEFLSYLWTTIQSMPDYAGKTVMLITCDHGRGRTVRDWTDHGGKVAGAEEWWLAALGPGVPADLKRTPDVTQSQVAATIASFLGEDWPAAEKRAATAIIFSSRLKDAAP